MARFARGTVLPKIIFDREADSLESAIRSAVADIQKTGIGVVKVEIDHDELVKV